MEVVDRETVDRLVAEFTSTGLTEVDARRSAFCALTYHDGWNAARIGRYLGISRARVGQRIERMIDYIETRDDMPTLKEMVTTAVAPQLGGTADPPVGFRASSWDDPVFARGILYLLAA